MGRSPEPVYKSSSSNTNRPRHRSPELQRKRHHSRSRSCSIGREPRRQRHYSRSRSCSASRESKRRCRSSRSPYSRSSPSRTRTRRNDDGKSNGNKRNKSGNKFISKRLSERKIWAKIKQRQKLRKAHKRNFELSEHQVLCQATEQELQRILQDDEFLGDIPYDCTPQELKSEIALAKGHATTVYVQRDGLSTLTVVLPQDNPTIANLKRGIESTARIQLQREQRQRHEDRMRRRNEQRNESNAINSSSIEKSATSSSKQIADDVDEDDRQQVSVVPTKKTSHRKGAMKIVRNTGGELVYSEALSGQQHRANVSWRFLWRAYALFHVDTRLPLNDENGRKLLSECGIENAAKFKFCNRDKYFGRKRQR